MSATILSFAGEKVIDLATGQFARPIILPVGWSKIRIGFKSFLSVAGALAGTPRYAVGIQHGTTNLPGDANGDYFIGAVSNSATWSNSAGFIFNVGVNAAQRNGAAYSFSGTAIKTDARMTAPAFSGGTPWIVEIETGSPNYMVNLFTAQTGVTIPTSQQMLDMMNMSVPAFTNCTWGTAQPIAAADEATAQRDAVAVWWNRTAPDMYLHEMIVAVVR